MRISFQISPHYGALLQSSTTHQVGVKYDSDSFNQTFQYVTPSNTYAPSDTFSFDGATISIPSSSTGTFTYAFPAAINLSNYNPADLICIVMRVDTPQDVSSISLNFDVAGSGYTSSYYTKTVIPVSYQGFITDPLSTDAITALTDQVLLDSLTNSSSSSSSLTLSPSPSPSPSSSPSPSLFSIPIESIGPPTKYTSSLVSNSGVSSYGYVPSQLNPASLATNSAWSTIYLQKGDFLPVGNAGQPGLDWTVITGFQLAITTNTSGDTDVDLNTLYLQGDPTSNGVGTNAGPSSYAGVGYDIRYIFKNSSTGTPSNPSSQQLFSTTPLNPGAVSTLVVLRQAIDVVGQYSTDTQADLVQIFVRGGLYGDTWRYVDQFPNLPLSLPVENIAYISVITTLIGYEVVLTTQSVNVFQTGTPVTLSGLTTMPALNGQTLFVNSTPSPSQLEFAFISPPVADETITEISITDVAPHYPINPQARYVILTLSAPNQYSVGTSIVLSGLTVFPQLNGYVALISELPSPSQILFAVGSPDSMSLPPTYPTTPETGLITPSAVPSAVSVSVETRTITPALNSFPGAGLFNYRYILPDTALQQGQILGLANDVPITSSLQIPVNTTLTTAVVLPASPNINYPLYMNVTVADPTTIFRVNQIVTVGTPANLEQTLVIVGGVGQFTAWFQLSHTVGEPVQAFSLPAQPVTLQAIAYNTNWWAGDPNNPHYLYYANYGFPENAGPQNYIPCGTPSDPIVLVENRKGTLYVATLSTWYKIFPGNPPYAQSTGSKHGAASSYALGQAEGEDWYASLDGIRAFQGSDGQYMSLPIEWLWRNNPLTPVPLIDTSKLSKMLGAYNNSTATFVYIGQDEQPHRIIFDRNYKRWRNDDVPVTAMYLETDTNTLVYSIPLTIGTPPGPMLPMLPMRDTYETGWAVVYDSYSQDYDDGGWLNGGLVQRPIPIDLQTPYLDVGAPNNQKQFNVLTIDANPNGQVLTPTLLFDGMNGDPTSLPTIPSTFTGSSRDKFDFQINSGLGQQAYQISLQITGNVTAAPILYQAELYAAVLADQRSSYDTYLITLGTNETKLVKQAFIDYTTDEGVSLNLSLYADGDTKPYFTFTLPPNTTRHKVPMRVRFPAKLLRLFRMVILGSGDGSGQFQLWSPVTLEWKNNSPASASGFRKTDLGDTTP